MRIEFEFSDEKGFDFARTFADHFNRSIDQHKVVIPDMLGVGYIKEVSLNSGLALCLHQYQLKQTFVLKRLASLPREMLIIKFDGRPVSERQNGFFYESSVLKSSDYAVEIASSNLFTEVTLSPGHPINLLVISITRQTLMNLPCFN